MLVLHSLNNKTVIMVEVLAIFCNNGWDCRTCGSGMKPQSCTNGMLFNYSIMVWFPFSHRSQLVDKNCNQGNIYFISHWPI